MFWARPTVLAGCRPRPLVPMRATRALSNSISGPPAHPDWLPPIFGSGGLAAWRSRFARAPVCHSNFRPALLKAAAAAAARCHARAPLSMVRRIHWGGPAHRRPANVRRPLPRAADLAGRLPSGAPLADLRLFAESSLSKNKVARLTDSGSNTSPPDMAGVAARQPAATAANKSFI